MWHQHNRQQALVVDLCRPLQPCIHARLASRSYAMEALLLDCSTGSVVVSCQGHGEMSTHNIDYGLVHLEAIARPCFLGFLTGVFPSTGVSQAGPCTRRYKTP